MSGIPFGIRYKNKIIFWNKKLLGEIFGEETEIDYFCNPRRADFRNNGLKYVKPTNH